MAHGEAPPRPPDPPRARAHTPHFGRRATMSAEEGDVLASVAAAPDAGTPDAAPAPDAAQAPAGHPTFAGGEQQQHPSPAPGADAAPASEQHQQQQVAPTADAAYQPPAYTAGADAAATAQFIQQQMQPAPVGQAQDAAAPHGGGGMPGQSMQPYGGAPAGQQQAPAGGEAPVKVFIGQLPVSFTEADVRGMLAPYGIVDLLLMSHTDTGKSKGCGFVWLASRASAEAAIAAIDGKVVLISPDRPVKLAFSLSHDSGPPNLRGGGGGSGPRGAPGMPRSGGGGFGGPAGGFGGGGMYGGGAGGMGGMNPAAMAQAAMAALGGAGMTDPLALAALGVGAATLGGMGMGESRRAPGAGGAGRARGRGGQRCGVRSSAAGRGETVARAACGGQAPLRPAAIAALAGALSASRAGAPLPDPPLRRARPERGPP